MIMILIYNFIINFSFYINITNILI